MKKESYTTVFTPERLDVHLTNTRSSKNNHLAILFKKMKSDSHIIHYKLGPITGGRKFTNKTSGDYYIEVGKYFNIIDCLAECGNEDALAQAMIQVLYAEFNRTCNRWRTIIKYWKRGWKNKAKDLYGYYYGTMNENTYNELIKRLATEEKLVALLEPCVIGYFDDGMNWIKN